MSAIGIGQNIDQTRDRDASGSFYMDPGDPPKKRKRDKQKKKRKKRAAKAKIAADVKPVLDLAEGKDEVMPDTSSLRPPIVPNAFRKKEMLTVREWLEQHPFEPLENASAVVDFPKDWSRYNRIQNAGNILRSR